MRAFTLPLGILFMTAVLVVPASAQDTSSTINPFKQNQPQGVTGLSLNTDQETDSKSFWPQFKSKPKKNPGQPSTLQKMNQNTKQFMKKSQHTLMPWTKPKKTSTPITGLREKPQPAESWNPLSNLFKPKEEEGPQFRTANDWFKQPRPELQR